MQMVKRRQILKTKTKTKPLTLIILSEDFSVYEYVDTIRKYSEWNKHGLYFTNWYLVSYTPTSILLLINYSLISTLKSNYSLFGCIMIYLPIPILGHLDSFLFFFYQNQ